MWFDPRRSVLRPDGALDHAAQQGYQDALSQSFGDSREAWRARDRIALVYCDALVHCVHEHHRARFFDLDADGLRRVLWETLPRYVETTERDAAVIVSTWDALFSWMKRAHRAPHADACLAVLREPGVVERLAAAIDDPAVQGFRPTMRVVSFDEDAVDLELDPELR